MKSLLLLIYRGPGYVIGPGEFPLAGEKIRHHTWKNPEQHYECVSVEKYSLKVKYFEPFEDHETYVLDKEIFEGWIIV